MARIQIHNLTKRFGAMTAVSDLTLDIADREFMVLLGPSGAGKTTTLRCVAGVETPDAGEVLFDGRPMRGVPPAARDVAFVFQTYALYPRKTAYENIAFPLEARRLPRAAIDERVRAVARTLHIEHLLERRPAQLSGGEQQRVALGRAMVRSPQAFLMDEPLTNLDFKLRVEMRAELKRIHEDLNTTLFYVTNDQVEAMSLADRIAVLNAGVLQQVGTPEEIYDRPVNRFVAGFIGSPRMNFLPCVLEGGEHVALVGRDGAWRLPLPAPLREAATACGAGELVLGVRPEDIALHGVPPSGDDAIPAEVYAVEPLGDRTIVDLRLAEAIVKVRAAPTFDAPQGARTWLAVDRARIHLFDPRTDLAIV
ncbi:MAG TPA: ABC transporter ATP-binding protein [Roseiflexaceae bacterium]|nr:ABC transporter ATP-binding protein [Roseiflexaceae bacterium]